MEANKLTEFIVPYDEIKTMNKHLQNIPELAEWFAFGVAFVTYELSYTTEIDALLLDKFSKEHFYRPLDNIISLKDNDQNFHSCMKTTKGQFWIVPEFSIPKGKLTLGITEIGGYINFDVNTDPSIWYVIIFKYDITKIALPKSKINKG